MNSKAKSGLGVVLLVVALPCLSGEPKNRTVRLWGEVAQGLMFRKSIGRGLDFVLSPETMGSGITGWTIQVAPHGKPPHPECADYVWVVTPPFRFMNARFLSTAYGFTAQEAVQMSPREFNFVLNCMDYRAERELLERYFSAYKYSEEEVDADLARRGTIRQGRGRLWIRDTKYTPGDKSTHPPKYGEIHWIKFEVRIKFPDSPQK
jgi:hypothetical protein